MTITASSDSLRDMVEVAPGLAMPRMITIDCEGVAGYNVSMDVAGQDGRLAAVEIRVTQRPGGPPVTGEALRSIPVAAVTKLAGAKVVTFEQKDGYVEMTARVLTPEMVEDIRESGPTKKTLDWVAYLYRLAVLQGEPPTQAVETTLQVPRSTAGRWVAQARRQGFLGPAEGQGKAGG